MSVRFMRVGALVLLSVLFLPATAAAEPELDQKAREALDTLIATDVFAGSAVGAAGSVSDNVAAFRVLLADEQADTAFDELMASGKVAGQLYALAGLYYTDPAQFSRHAKRLALSEQTVDTQFGCMKGTQRVGELVRAAGAIQVPSGQTLADAVAASSGGPLDISGGGYPLAFAGSGAKAPARAE